MTDARDYQMDPDSGTPADEWIAIPDTLLSAALREMDPIPQPPPTGPDARRVAERHSHMTSDVSRKFIAALIEFAEEGADDGDPSVGLYGNGLAELARELRMALEGKLTCRDCGGDGFQWSQEQFLRETARQADETGESVEEVRSWGDGPGYYKCPTCEGQGVVRLERQNA